MGTFTGGKVDGWLVGRKPDRRGMGCVASLYNCLAIQCYPEVDVGVVRRRRVCVIARGGDGGFQDITILTVMVWGAISYRENERYWKC